MAFKSPDTLVQAYGITIFVTVVGAITAVLLSAMTGYVLARPDFPGEIRYPSFSSLPPCSAAAWCPGI